MAMAYIMSPFKKYSNSSRVALSVKLKKSGGPFRIPILYSAIS